MGDEVEGDVEASGARGHGVGVPVDRGLVESVDPGRLGHAPRGADPLRDRLQRLQGPTGQMDPGPLAGEGAGDRPADRAAPAVDDGVPALEQHADLLASRLDL
jgi:hypothetical protein